MITNQPLKGIEVLEFSQRLSVSACGYILSQLGARVTVLNESNTITSASQIEHRLKHQGKFIDNLSNSDHHLFFKKFRVIIT